MSVRFKNRILVFRGGGEVPKVTEAYLEARRQQVLDAAAECFARKGFHRTTMHDICQMAELSPGAVYRYFRSKDEIIGAMEEQGRQHSAAIMDAVTSERSSTLDVLEGLVDVFFSKLEDVRDCAVHIELWAEALSNPRIKETVVRVDESIREAFSQRIVKDAQRRGEIHPNLDRDAVARVLMAFWHGLVLQKPLDPTVDIRKYVAVMKAMISGTFWQKTEAGRS